MMINPWMEKGYPIIMRETQLQELVCLGRNGWENVQRGQYLGPSRGSVDDT
jgi:hypothetical protein